MQVSLKFSNQIQSSIWQILRVITFYFFKFKRGANFDIHGDVNQLSDPSTNEPELSMTFDEVAENSEGNCW